MAKRGRPPGPPKPAKDLGTTELRLHRLALVGDADDPRASYPLGVLYARRRISQGEHYAGNRYGALFALAVRPLALPSAMAGLIAGMSARSGVAVLLADAQQHGAEARSQYLAARGALAPAEGRSVDRVVVYQEPLRTAAQLDQLRAGLDKLRRHFEEADSRSRRSRRWD